MRKISEDRERMVDDDPVFAIAAYKVVVQRGNEVIGQHVGIFEKAVDAESWLKTGEPQPQGIRIAKSHRSDDPA